MKPLFHCPAHRLPEAVSDRSRGDPANAPSSFIGVAPTRLQGRVTTSDRLSEQSDRLWPEEAAGTSVGAGSSAALESASFDLPGAAGGATFGWGPPTIIAR